LLLALGTPLSVSVKPWYFFEVDAVVVSAYYIMKNEGLRKRVYRKGIKDVLDFDGMVVLDSGAFQALRSGRSLRIDQLSDIYENVEDADVKLSLDWPDKKIIENYEELRRLEVFPVVPVASRKCLEYFEEVECDWIFVGRLAKMLMHYGRNAFELLETSLTSISSITKKRIWALGVGNWKTIPILMRNHVEGADTSSYRVAAAYGDIIVPGIGTCHVSGKKIGKKNWGMRLARKGDVECYLDTLNLRFDDLKRSFEARVLFNASVLNRIRDDVTRLSELPRNNDAGSKLD